MITNYETGSQSSYPIKSMEGSDPYPTVIWTSAMHSSTMVFALCTEVWTSMHTADYRQ